MLILNAIVTRCSNTVSYLYRTFRPTTDSDYKSASNCKPEEFGFLLSFVLGFDWHLSKRSSIRRLVAPSCALWCHVHVLISWPNHLDLQRDLDLPIHHGALSDQRWSLPVVCSLVSTIQHRDRRRTVGFDIKCMLPMHTPITLLFRTVIWRF